MGRCVTAERWYEARPLRALRLSHDKGLRAPRRAGRAQLYSAADGVRVQLILKGKRLGFTLAEISEMVEAHERQDAGADQQLKLSREKCMEQIAHLEQQRREIEDAILELKLYRLARLEILVIQQELAERRKRARQIAGLLKDEEGRWKLVREELEETQGKYGNAKPDPARPFARSAAVPLDTGVAAIESNAARASAAAARGPCSACDALTSRTPATGPRSDPASQSARSCRSAGSRSWHRTGSPRRRSQKSTSISGIDTRSGFRKRSNSRS